MKPLNKMTKVELDALIDAVRAEGKIAVPADLSTNARKVAFLTSIQADKPEDATPAKVDEPEKEPAKEDTTPKPVEKAVVKPLYYKGAVVTGIENKLVSGKVYKNVSTHASTFTLSVEEYNRDVKPLE